MGHEDDYRGKNVSAEKAQIWKSLKDEYWGSADDHWMMLSAGGDITLILSILVDTFISKISLTMQPGPKIDSISGA